MIIIFTKFEVDMAVSFQVIWFFLFMC